METGIQPPSNFWASKIATVREAQRAAEEADDAAWVARAAEVGVLGMKRERALQQAQETEPGYEVCTVCGSEVFSSGSSGQGIAEKGLTGPVQRMGRDPRQTIGWRRCSNFSCSPREQSGSGAYSPGGRYF